LALKCPVSYLINVGRKPRKISSSLDLAVVNVNSADNKLSYAFTYLFLYLVYDFTIIILLSVK